MGVDEAIDGFLSAVSRAAGAPVARPPANLSALHELEATIAPLQVPAAVRRFWQRVDPGALGADTYPGLHGPGFALTSWLMSRDEASDSQPTALLQIAYESHQCMSAELDQPDVAGGTLFEWNLVDGDFERRFDGLEGWLVYLTGLIGAERFGVYETPHGQVVCVPRDEDWEIEPQWRPRLAAHPVYGLTTHVGRDILDWPEHWQRLTGLTPARILPRGASHTISELMQTDPGSQVHATVVAKVVSLVGGSGGTSVRVHDGTDMLVVHCLRETTLLGPTIDAWFEFDVVLPAGPRALPADPDTVGLDEPDPSLRLEAQFLAQYAQPAGAIATAVRRTQTPAT